MKLVRVMGKRGGKRPHRGRDSHRGRNSHRPGVRADYAEISKHNHLFEDYYNGLGIVDEDEQTDFWAALRRELPNSFRFTGSRSHALAVRERLEDHHIPEITKIDHFDGEKVEPPFPIPWYPDRLAWAMTTPKKIVRRYAPFATFQKFLVAETSVGNISRQETVSMIPPLLMGVKPHMAVLDLCAAPGSKAAQLIEMIHAGEETRVRARQSRVADELEEAGATVEPVAGREGGASGQHEEVADDGRSTGLLIANDADYRRSHMLIHQMKRLNSPNLIVTNHDATMYPLIRLPASAPAAADDKRIRYLKFDRILADVPCSGDGTVRKNPNVWRDWNPGLSLGLHQTQVRILTRALQMLKVGGRVVYSTCSMNPIENEAVVASVVDRCGGPSKIRIVDCAGELPLLRRRPGLGRWRVIDKLGRVWSSWDAVEQQRGAAGSEGLSRLSESMFAPSEGPDGGLAEDDDRIPLERCMRIYAHMQDTGAFFIAVLEKLSEFKARPESEPRKNRTGPPAAALATAAAVTTTATTTLDVDAVTATGAAPADPALEGAVPLSAGQAPEQDPNLMQP